MARADDVATGQAKKRLRTNKHFKDAVTLRRILTALSSFSLMSRDVLTESKGAVLDHRLDELPDAVHVAKRLEVPIWLTASKRARLELRTSMVRDEILDVGDTLAALGMNPGALKEIRLGKR